MLQKEELCQKKQKKKISKSNNGKKRSLDFCTKMSDLKKQNCITFRHRDIL